MRFVLAVVLLAGCGVDYVAPTGGDDVPVDFTITTYWKRPRRQNGLTSMKSRRLTISRALDWVLDELRDTACAITSRGEVTTITIDWSKVPDAVRYGPQKGRR